MSKSAEKLELLPTNPIGKYAIFDVKSIADLRSIVTGDTGPLENPPSSPLVENGTAAHVLGYYSKNDGGGGVFIFDALSNTADDSGKIIAPDSGRGRWIRQIGTEVNVKMFGATGDGMTDDRAAILAAALSGAQSVYFPHGTYLVAASFGFPAGVSAYGDGISSLIYAVGATADALLMTIGSNCRIHDIGFKNSDAVNPNVLLQGSSVSNVAVDNCYFETPAGFAVRFLSGDSENISISNCYFHDVTYGILTDVNAGNKSLKSIAISNNRFDEVNGDAIEINNPGTHNLGTQFCQHAVIFGNIIRFKTPAVEDSSSSGFGIGLAGVLDFSVIGNVIHNCRQQGIHVEDYSARGVIASNTIVGSQASPAGTNAGILVGGASNFTINSNNIRDIQGSGIWLLADEISGVSETIVIGNHVKSCTGNGITVNGSVVDPAKIKVANNYVDSCGVGIDSGSSVGQIFINHNFIANSTTYGLNVRANSEFVNYSDNTITNSGTAEFNNVSATHGFEGGNAINQTVGVVAANDTPWFSAIDLGGSADGYVTIHARVGNDSACTLYKISWDGAALTAVKIGGTNVGGFGDANLQMAGHILQAKNFYAVNDASVKTSVSFRGARILI
jgi:hypothetical protein